MDTAVGLVEAYLRLNGYLTVTEYPLLELGRNEPRMATDLDVLAFRFPNAGHEVRSRRNVLAAPVVFSPDPALGTTDGHADMIVGEVKEGRASFNPAARNPLVLAAGLARFGCCGAQEAKDLAQQLIHHGAAQTQHGHTVRMVAFGSRTQEPSTWHTVSTAHMLDFITNHLEEHWGLLRHTDFKNPVLSFLALMRKGGGEREST